MTFGTMRRARGQPKRDPDDLLYVGARVLTDAAGKQSLLVYTTVADGREVACVELSEFNAWALFGVLSLFLGVSLPKTKACKSIKFWGDSKRHDFTLKIS